MSASATKPYRFETRLVHSGTLRSQFGETSEALFLTQGYVYETAAIAEKRFKGEEPGYQYSRFSNPTVAMFEARMCALEGAEAARATATGMAAVTTALMGQLRAGDHIAPGRRGRRHASAEEAQRGLEDDDVADVEGGEHEDGGNQVGHDVAEDDRPVARAMSPDASASRTAELDTRSPRTS